MQLVINYNIIIRGVKNIKINVIDKGALDCTIKARVECAVLRACEASDKNIAWGGMIK